MNQAQGRTTIERLAKRSAQPSNVVRALIEALAEEIDERGVARVPHLGTFTVCIQKARKLKNIIVDRIIEVPKARVVRFKADDRLKRRLNPEKRARTA